MIKGVIFDMDGTLLDSMGMWDDIGNRFLDSIGIDPKNGLNEVLRPMSFDEALIYFTEEYGVNMTFTEFMTRVNEIVTQYYRNECVVKDGIPQLLSELKSKKIPMAIATLTDIEQVEIALSHCGIRDYFDVIVTCTMVNASKKHPDVYRAALEKIKTEKAETLVIEDVYTALNTAKNDGFRTAGIYDSFADKQKEIRETADFYFENYKDLSEFWKWAQI